MEDIENPKGSLSVEIDRNLTGLASRKGIRREDLTQIRPQKLSLKLRPGEPQTFSLHIQRAKDYPVDLYYLADLSISVQNGLENMKKLGIELKEEMQKITSDFRIGFGILQRNPCAVGETCPSQFSFRNVLSLSSDGAMFNSLLQQQTVAVSLNSSEDGTAAIMQAAVCGDVIGWRNAIRLFVYYSNTGLHFSGDDKHRSMLPNDGKCHIDSHSVYKMNHHYNHPSVSHLAQKLEKNKIHLFFAVKEELKDIYQTLQNSIAKSKVGILTSNSSNVIKLILDAYRDLSSEIILENSKLPRQVSIDYTAHCNNNTVHTGEDGRKCLGIQIGDEVNFIVSITAKKCPKNRKKTFNIEPWGLNEKVEIDLEFVCECECHKNGIPNSPHCHQGNGMFECGTCRCNEGWIGQFCECNIREVFSDDIVASCQEDKASPICSNKGDCICGQCACKRRENPNELIYGRYCECDNFSCDRHNGLICGGNGICNCGRCECTPAFTGNACECSLEVESCTAANGRICNDRGTCECGRCRCTDMFVGPTCEQCPTCSGVCTNHVDCVLCKAFNKGPKKDTCNQCEFEVTLVEGPDQLSQRHCRFIDVDIGWFCFSYAVNDQGVPEVRVVQTPGRC